MGECETFHTRHPPPLSCSRTLAARSSVRACVRQVAPAGASTMLRICFVLPLLVVAVTSITTSHYVKVDNSLPDSIAPCLLRSISIPLSEKMSLNLRCGAVCSETPYCSLYCLKGNRCDFFNAKVTKAWVGPGSGVYLYDYCFSVHPAVGDVALGAATQSSSVYSVNYNYYPTQVNFFCQTETACYESLVDTPPWWRADFGSPRRVTRVRISLTALIDINVVEFRVGNDTTVTNNPLLLPKPTFTPTNGLEVVADTPIVGRYFFVTEPQYSDIRICDVWVMTK
ncbi:uncharacterized protein LOC135089247 [Scylla paramamosain]|uniref:uncharacterized protein LOC135089247 n=1 Tax=Scylla paramamosain TaxID=85552 RepID=UPI003082B8EE